MNQTKIQKVLEIIRHRGTLRPKDLDDYDIPRIYIRRLIDRGLLYRIDRGLYVSANADFTEYHTLVEASKRVPHGVICLLSALHFHHLTTQIPSKVWMAIERKARKPLVDRPLIRFSRYSGLAFKTGVDEHKIEGVSVKVYNPAKTVVDCFKYRNKIGLDIALEALKDCYQERKCTINDLWYYARICRLTKVMTPYMEAIV